MNPIIIVPIAETFEISLNSGIVGFRVILQTLKHLCKNSLNEDVIFILILKKEGI